jgi:hypothetical protein
MAMTLTQTVATSKQIGLLRTLADRMQSYGVGADVRLVAAVLLETARELDWAYEPEGVSSWMTQLALELGKTSTVRLGPSSPRRTYTADSLPLAKR